MSPAEQTVTETPSLASQPPASTSEPPKPGEQPKPAEAAKPEVKPEAKPPEYVPVTEKDIKLPEGVEPIDAATNAALVGIMNEFKVPKEGLQKLVDLQVGIMKAASEKGSALWDQVQEGWRKEIGADPEFGGAKLPENLGQVARLIDKYGDKELRGVLDLTGAGNNPHVIRFLTRIAREVVKEGSPVSGVTPAVAPRTHADILFPNQGKT